MLRNTAMTATQPPTVQAQLHALLCGASIEVPAHDESLAQSLQRWFAAGSEVYVNFIPGGSTSELVRMAAALRRAGYTPVPHLAPRNLASRAELEQLVAALAAQAGCDRALLIAGDAVEARGAPSTLEVLRSDLLPRHGFRAVGIAGHPEGHHSIRQSVLWRALHDKIAAAQEAGLRPWIVTQFCFEAEPVVAWLKALRREGLTAPVRIGVAGPASLTTLVKFAIRCGVGNSLRVLQNRPHLVSGLLGEGTPDDVLRGIASQLAQIPGPAPGLHIFPFGGIARTGRWLAQRLRETAEHPAQAVPAR